MPQASNITVKKNDGVTDVTYTSIQPSSGDGVQAVWKSTTVGTAPAHQPELRASARSSRNGRGREVRWTHVFPQISTNTTTNVTSVIDSARCSASFEFPTSMDSASINEAVAQFANLLASAAAKGISQSGYGPT